MVSEFAGNLPILGKEQSKVRATTSGLVALVRTLDENGTFEPESSFLANGQVQAVAGRSNLASAEDLCDMICDALMPRIRDVVKQELAHLKE